ncbi:MAG: hypothetical protein AAF598_13110 [Bacteroidota bacterium]
MDPRLQNAINLYMEGIRDGHYEEAVNKYTGNRYTQHSTGVKDGKEGFIEFFSDFTKRNPIRDIKVFRSLVDERYVFLQAYQSLNHGEYEYVTTDFFDFDDNNKVIEHWDVIALYSDHTPSGHTSIDGPTEVTDLDKTEENKELVRKLIQDALMEGGNPENLPKYISSEQYIQHNKDVPDGLDAFLKLATQPNPPLRYKRIVLMVGQGNFVATLSEANWKDDQIDQDYAQVDIFRIENGKVVEHWDNVEPVPDTHVNSGKF